MTGPSNRLVLAFACLMLTAGVLAVGVIVNHLLTVAVRSLR